MGFPVGLGAKSIPVVYFFKCPKSFSVMRWMVKVLKLKIDFNFLAPTGAQGVTMSGHNMLKTSLEQSIFIFLGQRAFRKKSKGN